MYESRSPVRLLSVHHEMLLGLRDGSYEFPDRIRCAESTRDMLRDVAGATLRHYERWPRSDPWGTYLTVDLERCLVVGVGSFKFPPSPDGEVEIAYYTFPLYEGNGYATAMAAGLADIAARAGEIRSVIAHTLPEENASSRVLTRCGFASDRTVIKTDEGRVWRWVLATDERIAQNPRSDSMRS